MRLRTKWLALFLWAFPMGVFVADAIQALPSEKLSSDGSSKSIESIFSEAEKAYRAGEKEAAKKLYLAASRRGSADAHFSLYYKFILSAEESNFHCSEAARKGHSKALGYALDDFLFRAGNSLDTANPQLALELYEEAKKANPKLRLYDEAEQLRAVSRCVEMSAALGPFDAEKFRAKYKIKNPNEEPATWRPYFIWSLAEEACRGGRFGKPNRELAFQLMIRGGQVPAEFKSAVEEAYGKWKRNEPYRFVIDHHVTSGIGSVFCNERDHRKVVESCKKEIDEIGSDLSAQDQAKLLQAYEVFTKHIEEKAWKEEGHGGGGSWRTAWILSSIIMHKQGYLKLVKSVENGFRPEIKHGYKHADRRLNKVYQILMADLKGSQIFSLESTIKEQDVRDVQRLWIPYRDSTAELFSILHPAVDEMSWKTWLTVRRTKQLETLIEWKKGN